MSKFYKATHTNNTLEIKSDDILRLIGAHLTEQGHHQTARTLQQETKIGLAASFVKDSLPQWIKTGQWDAVLTALEAMDPQRNPYVTSLQAQAYACTILELADQGEWDVAYATYRFVQHFLHEQSVPDVALGTTTTWGRLIEQNLAALAAVRQINPQAPVPHHYYEGGSLAASRERLVELIEDCVPSHPRQRLPMLLQQAVQWQSHTGMLPQTKQYTTSDDKDNENKNEKKCNKRKKQFDLVLGSVRGEAVAVDDLDQYVPNEMEPIPQAIYSTISFGKKATCEAAVFTPDGANLITGSSDGLIEIWDARQQYSKLNIQDYEYQKEDKLMGHDAAVTALAISYNGKYLASGSTDGTVVLWSLHTGSSLEKISVVGKEPVTSLSFRPESDRYLLMASGSVVSEYSIQELKLDGQGSRIKFKAHCTKEFRGHTSYITSCHYVTIGGEETLVATSSGDGTVRIWNQSTGEVSNILKPRDHFAVGQSMVVNTFSDGTDAMPVNNVISLQNEKLLMVPRSTAAFIVSLEGIVEQRFVTPSVIVAATLSSSQHTLYAVQENGECAVFNVKTGELVSSIRDFATQGSRSQEAQVAEISAMLYHPYKHILGAFSNDKRQSKGKLVLWK
ncbi:WD40 repeat-containing protein SMU1 [Fistulifera solaris]|uniref:WD40 repeat-containing protein SMU1 n=1 Tax=Fistulifera solaris TaxID=1519565 RepID=A0A1Z5KAF1_FISSO|nr:WD40 repeat-containing protein SMU1 [Fistulifera solaris]|eukprot:GAX23142.1 WD40 repeat-containing protein SMU1 [Fistulifera solaris]